MVLTKYINKNQHAYLIEGDRLEIIAELRNTIEEIFGVTTVGNPDYRVIHFDIFGIDEARAIKEEQGRMAFSGENKFFVISTDALTREAQNALLKVFEEPTVGTYLFLITLSLSQILPTLISRVRVIKTVNNLQLTINNNADTFLKTPVDGRLQLPFVKEFLKRLSEDKNKQPIASFFNELERRAYEKLPAEKMTKFDQEFFAELIKFKGYASDRSSSVKMLLEHISLTAPVIK